MATRDAKSNWSPFVGSIFHPTDLSPASAPAFAYALAMALIRRTRLDILHVGGDSREDWARFPAVRETLERWGLLEPGSDRSAVYDELAVRVTKVQLKGDPVSQTLDYVHHNEPDLLVLATRGRQGLARWLDPSIAQRIGRRSRTMTLFVPTTGRQFISLDDGHLSLRRILLPVDRTPDATEALVKAARAAEAMGDPPVAIDLLHVGDEAFPDYARPEGDAWIWSEQRRDGPVSDAIVEVADSLRADLIVMPTDGRNGALDALRGSFTERV
ncbi:MAG: universal stress protein, partial [Deltaproteobacteria bacterium]|nr:universal stress protein [Deltaproteobacteria bacterium]